MKTQKIQIKDIIKKIKSSTSSKVPVQPSLGRDMRQEAIDMGSHGAKEIFGGKDGRAI